MKLGKVKLMKLRSLLLKVRKEQILKED